jgi:aryl-alcohol dehydrogenase-like predicted oxidoreductase
MKYASLGNSGLVVSRIAFGTMTFTDTNKAIATVQKVDPSLAHSLVARAIDAGVNFFDTADVYSNGESETVLGQTIKGRRQNLVIASKVGLRTGSTLTQSGLSRRHILWSIDQSLSRLGTDWIDVYVAHREDHLTPLEETLETLDALVRSGKVRYLAFSNWSAWQAAAALEIQKANGWAKFTHGQMHYSLLGRDVERDIVPMLRRYGLSMTVWSPLAFGFLTGKFTRETIRGSNSRFSEVPLLPFDHEDGFRLLEIVGRFAAAHQVSYSQIAIAWLLAREAVTSVLIGTTKLAQLEDNLRALDVILSEAELSQLDAATALKPVYPNWFIDGSVDQPMAKAIAGNGADEGGKSIMSNDRTA